MRQYRTPESGAFWGLVIDSETIMKMLKREARDGYWYLASPYTHYAGGGYDGRQQAFQEVSRVGGWLAKQGVPIFSPIAHTHPLHTYGGVPNTTTGAPEEYETAMALDQPMMNKAAGVIVAGMVGWNTSHGVAIEMKHFLIGDQPRLFMPWPAARSDINMTDAEWTAYATYDPTEVT